MSTTNFVALLRERMLGVQNIGLEFPLWFNNLLRLNPNFMLNIPLPYALKYFMMANFGLSVLNYARSKFHSIYSWVKSWFNASKYLEPTSTFYD